MGTIRLLQLCARYEVRKIIYASSAAVYGNPREVPVKETHATEPLSCYGVSKLVAEMYIQSFAGRYNLDYSILRYANVYGIREIRNGEDGVLTAFVERMIAGLPLEVYGDGSQTRDFIYVKDVAAANAAALRTGSRQVMNISSGTGISLLEAVDVLRELSGRNVSPQHRPRNRAISSIACWITAKPATCCGGSRLTRFMPGCGKWWSSKRKRAKPAARSTHRHRRRGWRRVYRNFGWLTVGKDVFC
ncbi:hypothetical protein HMSSN036_50800 [Paenibacillus macerans]|nr:hypothetical protein HMSSN036_50800 [Paenibacillus macerans]